jgi:hypothetical protein
MTPQEILMKDTMVKSQSSPTRVCQLLGANFSRVESIRSLYFSPEDIAEMEEAWEEAYEEGR